MAVADPVEDAVDEPTLGRAAEGLPSDGNSGLNDGAAVCEAPSEEAKALLLAPETLALGEPAGECEGPVPAGEAGAAEGVNDSSVDGATLVELGSEPDTAADGLEEGSVVEDVEEFELSDEVEAVVGDEYAGDARVLDGVSLPEPELEVEGVEETTNVEVVDELELSDEVEVDEGVEEKDDVLVLDGVALFELVEVVEGDEESADVIDIDGLELNDEVKVVEGVEEMGAESVADKGGVPEGVKVQVWEKVGEVDTVAVAVGVVH